MKRVVVLVVASMLFSFAAKAQKVDSIFFNLYTDSLKKGVHNYINVVGKLSNGTFLPLMADELMFSSNYGKWEGNSLIIDSAYQQDSIVVTASLKSKPDVSSCVTIYMKKYLETPALKTEKELLEEWRGRKKGKS